MVLKRSLAATRGIYIYAVVGIGVIISNFHQMAFSTISGDVAASLQADHATLALLVSVYAYTFAFMQTPSGILADTLGPRKSVTIALLVTALGTFLFGVSSGVPMAMAARICLGLGTAVILIPLMKLIAVWFSTGIYSKLVAFAMVLCSAGFLLATSPMAFAVAAVGWRATYVALAVFTACWAALAWLLIKDSPDAGTVPADRTPFDAQWIKTALKTVLKHKQVWVLGLWMFFQVGIYFAFIGLWAGQLLTQGMGFSTQESGWMLTIPACVLMASPVMTWLGERVTSRRNYLIYLSLLTLFLSLPLALGLPRLPPIMMTGYLFAFSLPAMGGIAIVYTMAKELFPIQYAGIVSGFVNSLPFLGAAILQQVIGVAAEFFMEYGASAYDALSKSFIVLVGSAVISTVLALRVNGNTCVEKEDRVDVRDLQE